MQITCIGVNHKTASVDLRERLAFSEENIRPALARLGCGSGLADVQELVILSTCNRIEIYAASSQPCVDTLEAFLAEVRGVRVDVLQPHLYRLFDEAVVEHLLEVAAGLDSLVLGEPQILGQVTHALELARSQSTVGVVLSRLFQTAIRAGKRARTETRISHNQVSIASLAAKLSEELIPALQDAEIVILGAGEMAELSVEAMRKRKASAILVVNRTQERARSLADRWQAESDTFENLAVALSRADVLVSSTGAPHLMISSSMVSKAMTVRPDRPLLLIDLAVPRDIDPQVAQIPNVHLYDIDGLNANLERSLNERAKEIPQVQAILAEESGAFSEFLQSLDMRPLIVDLRQQAETLRQMELEKTLRRLPNLTDDERQRIEALTLSLVNKMLHSPTLRLREEANCPHAPQYAAVARTLFGLSGDRCACHFSDKSCPLCAAD